jgi:hypothetical protein
LPGFDEFDVEKADDSWIVQLDLLATVPIAWLAQVRPGSSVKVERIETSDTPLPRHFPLRC